VYGVIYDWSPHRANIGPVCRGTRASLQSLGPGYCVVLPWNYMVLHGTTMVVPCMYKVPPCNYIVLLCNKIVVPCNYIARYCHHGTKTVPRPLITAGGITGCLSD